MNNLPHVIERIQKLMSAFSDFYYLEITEDEIFVKHESNYRCGYEVESEWVESFDEAEDYLVSQLISK